MIDDEFFMGQALVEAEKSLRKKEVPVGAVLVSGNKILSRGYNEPILKNDPTAHAEIAAIRKACSKKKNYRLLECELYVTLEPCAMCLSAAVQARVKRLVFGAYDPKAGAVESMMKFPVEKTNHRLEIKGGVLADECGKILRDFFLNKRGLKKKSSAGN
jgi:tRNA(adenine34) deaminase